MSKDERGVSGRSIMVPPRGHIQEFKIDVAPTDADLRELVDGDYRVVQSNYNGRPCQLIFNKSGIDAFHEEPLEENQTARDIYLRSGDVQPDVLAALSGIVVFIFGVEVPAGEPSDG